MPWRHGEEHLQQTHPEGRAILVVEDDDSIRETMKIVLEMEGYEVRTAANGREGLELLGRQSGPCLVLLDLMMPVMDGWQFVEAVERGKAGGSFVDSPIVAVTAVGERAKGVRVSEVVKKPLSIESLLGLVRRYCGERP